MNAFLAHLGLEPLIYGVIVFLGLTIPVSTGQRGRG
jgi:hypothetical protein